ncbi:MAG: alpha/beta hydrolase [Oscillospiraceae bacterium]|nr:alpha/beta hydrolase [Oscillospiraceae bacterium]
MNRNVKLALIGSGIAAAGAAAIGAASFAFTGSLVKVALDRELPKRTERRRQRLTGSGELSGLLEELAAAGQKLKDSDAETVVIRSHDGEKLVGHWYPHGCAERVIIAMHGWRSSWAGDFGIIAPFWRENRCSVLFPEQRGQGESGGAYMGFGLIERYDCLDWIRWVNGKTGGKLPIYLGGVSMGAATVLMAAGLELPENVRGIVADCGYTSPNDIWKHVMNHNLHLPYGSLTRSVVGRACRRRLQMGPKDCSCADALKHCRVPVLFVHGADDHFVPVEMTYENYKACAAPKRLFIVPGAEHGMSYLVNRQGYEAALRNFWQENDRPGLYC